MVVLETMEKLVNSIVERLVKRFFRKHYGIVPKMTIRKLDIVDLRANDEVEMVLDVTFRINKKDIPTIIQAIKDDE